MPSSSVRVEPVGELVGARAWAEPGVSPVGRRQEEQRGGRDIEIGAQLAALDPVAVERANPFLVAVALRDEAVAALSLEVAPLAHEDGRDVELAGDDGEMRPQRQADALGCRGVPGTASRPAWKASAPSQATSQRRSSFDAMWW